MLKINRIQKGDLIFYEALFTGGNLYAFSISELITQLTEIHNFRTSLFTFCLN